MKNTVMLTKQGKDVEVTHFHEDKDGHPHIRVTATCGTETYEEVMTIGAVDGPRVFQTQEEMQADLDTHRDKVAEMAAWRSHTKEIRDKLN